MADNAVVETNTIQAEENALTAPAVEQSSSDKSLIPATPTPSGDEGTPTLPGDTATEAATTGGEQPAATGAAAGDQQPIGADGKPSAPAWVQRRIDKLTAEKHEARRETEAARAEIITAKAQAAALLSSLAELRAAGGVQPAGTPDQTATSSATPAVQPRPAIPMAEAEIEARATAKAQEIARVNAFNKSCNDIAEAGKTDYADFDSALKNFGMLGGIPTAMLETLTEMPNAHKILYAVGKDPELAEKVMKLSPLKMAMELARIDQDVGKPPAPRPISTAPRPITPIETGGRAGEDLEKMSMAEFVAYRAKNKKSRW